MNNAYQEPGYFMFCTEALDAMTNADAYEKALVEYREDPAIFEQIIDIAFSGKFTNLKNGIKVVRFEDGDTRYHEWLNALHERYRQG